MKKDNKGFSLIELIVVIAIMAILVGVMAPNVMKYVETSRESADKQAADAIRTAVMTAIVDPNLTSADLPSAAIVKKELSGSDFSTNLKAKIADNAGVSGIPNLYAQMKSKKFKDVATGEGAGATHTLKIYADITAQNEVIIYLENTVDSKTYKYDTKSGQITE